MIFENFWSRYTSQRITDISDEVIKAFDQPFPEAIYEEYDLGEVVTEFAGHHETAKRFDKIEQFGRVLKANHPAVYAADHIYVNDALVTYYCFQRNREGLSRLVPDFLAYPTANFDQLEVILKRLIYHGYLDLAEEIVQEKYEEAQRDDDLFGGTAYEMGALKYYQLLSEYCRQAVEDDTLPQWSSFQQAVTEYGFELGEKHREAISQGLTQNVQEYVSRLREKNRISNGNRSRTVLAIEVMFLQEMQQYGMLFPSSGSVWSNLGSIWEGNRATRWEDYFHLTEATLRQLIVNRFGLFRDYRFEAALILWGSTYVIDFLHDKGLLTDDAHAGQVVAVEKVKQGFKTDFSFSL